MLPRGLVYEGLSDGPILLSGGSAAQSSAIQCFDALLCIRHEDETGKGAFPSPFGPSVAAHESSRAVCAVSWIVRQRKSPGKVVIFFLSIAFFSCSLHWFALSRRLPDTHERLHASCPPSADRNPVRLSVSARLHPVPLQLRSLPGLQCMCLGAGGFKELPPKYRDQVHHCAR